MDEGMPKLRQLLSDEQVKATMFVTGEVARRFPRVIDDLVADGHELGCHADTHTPLHKLTPAQVAREIEDSTRALRAHGDVVSFRAPFLQLPRFALPLLRDAGYLLDSSVGRHKTLRARVEMVEGVLRVPASITSSTLRWPRMVLRPLLAQLSAPAVLFVHPWEFVDLRRTKLRYDCRFKTGDTALECLRETIRFFKNRRARFGTIRECLPSACVRSANVGETGL
jgi:peptidoglycan/xylan/chitin deacetylase (PgdA/CDA1 family)